MKWHKVGDIFLNKITYLAYKKGTWLENNSLILTNDRKIKHFYKLSQLIRTLKGTNLVF